MSVQKNGIFAPLPSTTRAHATKLGSGKHGEIIYCSGKCVYLRNLHDPSQCFQYTQHNANTSVARIAPSGYYVASGDVLGNVKVWDPSNGIQKSEFRVLGGRINDLAWDGESKRLVAVGDGKEAYGNCFTFDSGNSVGEVSGHSGIVNAVSIRSTRPYSVVTASDDNSVVYYQAFPMKFKKTLKDHTGFVQDVQYAPDGSIFVSVGSDRKLFLYNAEGEKQTSIESPHQGSIFAVSFDPSSKSFLTSSADQTTKLWDVETQKVVQTWSFGNMVEDQQVGNAFAGNTPVSLSLSGDLHSLDKSTPDIGKVITGHQKSITRLAYQHDTLYSGSYDGRICSWNLDGVPTLAAQRRSEITDLVVHDQKLYATDSEGVASVEQGGTIAPQARSIAFLKDVLITAGEQGVSLGGKKVTTTTKSTATTMTSEESTFAVGFEDGAVEIFYSDGTSKIKMQANRASVTALAYSPNGDLLAAGDSAGKIILYDAKTGEVRTTRWGFHSARIRHVAWNSTGTHLASVSLDTQLIIYSVQNPIKNTKVPNVHKEGANSVVWVDGTTIITAGSDAAIKRWNVTI